VLTYKFLFPAESLRQLAVIENFYNSVIITRWSVRDRRYRHIVRNETESTVPKV